MQAERGATHAGVHSMTNNPTKRHSELGEAFFEDVVQGPVPAPAPQQQMFVAPAPTNSLIGRFSAAAYGAAASAKPGEGWSGVSASGWAIWDNDAGREVCREAKASEKANRRTWAATIRAIRGALEAEVVLPGSTIDVIAEARATETLARVSQGERTKKTGEPLADLELWDEVRAVVERKGLHVLPNLQRIGIGFVLLELLPDLVRRTAGARRTEIGAEVEAQTAIPPKRNPKKLPRFEPVEGYTEAPRNRRKRG
jgi:hypothetical protein